MSLDTPAQPKHQDDRPPVRDPRGHHDPGLTRRRRGRNVLPDDTRLSAARKGVLRPPEVGAKVSAALKGRPWTPERKEAARVRAAQRKGD